MTVASLFPASVMGVGGLFLSGYLPYFPCSLLIFLGLTLFILFDFLPNPWIPILFLVGSLIGGLFFFIPPSENPTHGTSFPFALCIDTMPTLSSKGAWVSGSETGTLFGSRHQIKMFIPEVRLPTDPLVPGDCLSGTLSPLLHESSLSGLLPSRPAYILSSSDVLIRSPGTFSFDWIYHDTATLKQTLLIKVRHSFPEDTAGLLAALVLSDTRYLPVTDQEDFRRAGITHLLSVSGEHMTLLALFLAGAFLLTLRGMPLPLLRTLSLHLPLSRLSIALILPILGLYTVMIGLPPAAVRACVAFSIVAILRLFFIDFSFEEVLGLSTLAMLAGSPSLAHSISFLLSLFALWGLVLVKRLPYRVRRGGGLSGTLQRSFLAGLIITFVTAPFLGFIFKTVNPLGLFANPVLVPLAGDLLLPLGFVDLPLLETHHLPTLLWVLTNALSHGVLGLAHGFAHLPGSEIPLLEIRPIFVLIFYAGLLLLLLLIPSFNPKPLLLFLILVIVFAVTLPASAPKRPLLTAFKVSHGFRLTYEPEHERANLNGLFQ